MATRTLSEASDDERHVNSIKSDSPNGDMKTEDVVPEAEPNFSHIDETKTLRKMDVRLLPVLTILYLLSFLDRGYGAATILTPNYIEHEATDATQKHRQC